MIRENPDDHLVIVPAYEALWEDLDAVLGAVRCHGAACFCQRYKVPNSHWRGAPDEVRADLLREQTECGNPGSETTSGLVAYHDGEPAGWCAVEPRPAFPRLSSRIPWSGRTEDKADAEVWAVTCFIVRAGFRGLGIIYALARAAIDHARKGGARAIEGYPMVTEPGKQVSWGELHVGDRKVFADAGFVEVSHPTLRRVVMRVDF